MKTKEVIEEREEEKESADICKRKFFLYILIHIFIYIYLIDKIIAGISSLARKKGEKEGFCRLCYVII